MLKSVFIDKKGFRIWANVYSCDSYQVERVRCIRSGNINRPGLETLD